MNTPDLGRLEGILKWATTVGASVAIPAVQSYLTPHIMNVFAEHDAEELETYIRSRYPLVEKQTPPGIEQTLDNLGSNPQIHEQYADVVTSLITPDNIIHWLRNPVEWLDEENADEQREELKRCADVIENTTGGRAWLEEQILQFYEYAHVVPKETKPPNADD